MSCGQSLDRMGPVTLFVLVRKLHWLCREMKSAVFPGTDQHLSYWSEKVWGGEDFLCSPVFSVSVWSISSAVCWTNDFSTLMLHALEIITNYLVEPRWVTFLSVLPCYRVFLTSAGDCSQFSTPFAPGNLYPVQLVWHLPWSAMASTFTILCQQRLYPFRTFPTTATLWKDHGRLENTLKDCQVGEHPPLQCLGMKEGFARLLSGMTETTKAQPNEVLGSSQSS